MMFSLRSLIRPIGAALICLMVLTQAGCATLQSPYPNAPSPGEGGSDAPGEGTSGLSDMSNVVVVVAVAAVVGYLIHKAITSDQRKAEDESEPVSSIPPQGASAEPGLQSCNLLRPLWPYPVQKAPTWTPDLCGYLDPWGMSSEIR